MKPVNWRKLEDWVKIKDYPNYKVSNMGRVSGRRKYLIPKFRNGAVRVVVRDGHGNAKEFTLKTLVADHFLIPRTPGVVVVFINTRYPEDCSICNIREVGSTQDGKENLIEWQRFKKDNWKKRQRPATND